MIFLLSQQPLCNSTKVDREVLIIVLLYTCVAEPVPAKKAKIVPAVSAVGKSAVKKVIQKQTLSQNGKSGKPHKTQGAAHSGKKSKKYQV